MASPNPLPPLKLEEVQGDILLGGLPKKAQTFFFFRINDKASRANEFRKKLADFVPQITTAKAVTGDRQAIAHLKKKAVDHAIKPSGSQKAITPSLIKMSGVNLAFSQKGLDQMTILQQLGDKSFQSGMLKDAKDLGDHGTGDGPDFDPVDWIPEFKQDIHGVILVTGDRKDTVDEKLTVIKNLFGTTISKVFSVDGKVRPSYGPLGDVSGHEHFGFLDGISQPAIAGVDPDPNPGQQTLPPGSILLGRNGDLPDQFTKTFGQTDVPERPSWALDGSFLVFRYLQQNVLEFNEFLEGTAKTIPGLPSELLGARMVGRWKSGTPIDISPLEDLGTDFGKNPKVNNDFRFDKDRQSQERCPFTAHIRKTYPREDLSSNDIRRILRRGIQFGNEVSPDETPVHPPETPELKRGLLFVCYQSSIANGFKFLQHSWANFASFPFGKLNADGTPLLQPGIDPIIGQTNSAGARTVTGMIRNEASEPLSLPAQWVVAKGGEYFFSPSTAALKNAPFAPDA